MIYMKFPTWSAASDFDFDQRFTHNLRKQGGPTGVRKKKLAKIFLAFLQYFGPINTILLKKLFRNFDSKWVKLPTEKSKNGK